MCMVTSCSGGDKYAGLWDKAQRQIARRKGLPPPDTKLPPSLEHLRDPMCASHSAAWALKVEDSDTR
eukprot:2076704-Amphidinium_carterae.1